MLFCHIFCEKSKEAEFQTQKGLETKVFVLLLLLFWNFLQIFPSPSKFCLVLLLSSVIVYTFFCIIVFTFTWQWSLLIVCSSYLLVVYFLPLLLNYSGLLSKVSQTFDQCFYQAVKFTNYVVTTFKINAKKIRIFPWKFTSRNNFLVLQCKGSFIKQFLWIKSNSPQNPPPPPPLMWTMFFFTIVLSFFSNN